MYVCSRRPCRKRRVRSRLWPLRLRSWKRCRRRKRPLNSDWPKSRVSWPAARRPCGSAWRKRARSLRRCASWPVGSERRAGSVCLWGMCRAAMPSPCLYGCLWQILCTVSMHCKAAGAVHSCLAAIAVAVAL